MLTVKQSLNQLLKYQLKLLNVWKTMFKLFVIVCVCASVDVFACMFFL